MVSNKVEKSIEKMCGYLEFYDKYLFFPFEKKRIDITISGEIWEKLKDIENRSEFIEKAICKSPIWNEDEGIIRIDKNMNPDDILKIIVNNEVFKEDLKLIGGIVRV